MAKKRKSWQFHIFLRNMSMLVIIGFIIYSLYVNFTRTHTELISVSFQNVPIITQHRALIMRNEKSITSTTGGKFTPQAYDGERVKMNQTIGSLEIVEFTDEELSQIPEALVAPLVTEEGLKTQIDELYASLGAALRAKDFINAKMLKSELEMKLSRMDKLLLSQSDSAYDTITTNIMIDSKGVEAGEKIEIMTTESGIITYQLDDYEDIISFENRYKISYPILLDTVIEPTNRSLGTILPNQPLGKIIDQFTWYIACDVAKSELEQFEIGSEVLTTIRDQDVKGEIVDVFEADGLGIMIIEMRSQPQDFYTYRREIVDIKRSEVRGILVPNTAIISKGEMRGVYQIDDNNQIAFVPISVLAEVENGVVVQEGSFIHSTEDGDQTLYTINHGEKIVNDAVLYKEGAIVE